MTLTFQVVAWTSWESPHTTAEQQLRFVLKLMQSCVQEMPKDASSSGEARIPDDTHRRALEEMTCIFCDDDNDIHWDMGYWCDLDICRRAHTFVCLDGGGGVESVRRFMCPPPGQSTGTVSSKHGKRWINVKARTQNRWSWELFY